MDTMDTRSFIPAADGTAIAFDPGTQVSMVEEEPGLYILTVSPHHEGSAALLIPLREETIRGLLGLLQATVDRIEQSQTTKGPRH